MSYQNKCVWVHIWEWRQERETENSVKNVANLGDWSTSIRTLYTRQQKRHRCIEQCFWTQWERARVGWFGRMALKHVYYDMCNESPVQVWCMIQGAQGWCTGMTQRTGMAREVGGGFRIGNTCTPMADSCQYMAKPVQYCKVISLPLK